MTRLPLEPASRPIIESRSGVDRGDRDFGPGRNRGNRSSTGGQCKREKRYDQEPAAAEYGWNHRLETGRLEMNLVQEFNMAAIAADVQMSGSCALDPSVDYG